MRQRAGFLWLVNTKLEQTTGKKIVAWYASRYRLSRIGKRTLRSDFKRQRITFERIRMCKDNKICNIFFEEIDYVC